MNSGNFSTLPTWAQVIVAALAVIQVVLTVTALVVLVRTPAQRVNLPKWAWAVIIVVVNTIGAIAFLVAGRRPAEVFEPMPRDRGDFQPGSSSGQSSSAANAADLLYGPRPGDDQPPAERRP